MDFLNFGKEGSYVNPGINEGAKLLAFEYSANENAEALKLEFKVNGDNTFKRLIYNKLDNARPFSNESDEDAKKREIGSLNAKLRSILCNFVTEEQLIARLKEMKPTDFKSLIDCYKSLLPNDFSERTGRLVLVYKNNGFLELAQPYQVASRKFFSLSEKDNMNVIAKYQDKLKEPSDKEEQNDLPFIV